MTLLLTKQCECFGFFEREYVYRITHSYQFLGNYGRII
jgi:hypothetical protein